MAQRKNWRAMRGRTGFHAWAESLEPRSLLSGATFDVVTTANAGTGSLRAAILSANTNPGSTIDFKIEQGPQTIIVTSPLPLITAPVLIDGTSQPGYAGTPLVTVEGQILTAPSSGFVFAEGSGGSVIQALAVTGFGLAGVEVIGVSHVTIGGTTSALGNNLYGNAGEGVRITSAGASENVVEGNVIGLDASAERPFGNGTGVEIDSGATRNVIGGTGSGERNVISGNVESGVLISGTATSGNTIEGDDIGTDGTAMKALGNQTGVEIDSGATANVIGGTVAAARNIISGNAADGVLISDVGTSANLVEGDYIGICNCTSGPAALANETGVEIAAGATANTIGGSTSGAGNVISGNFASGVLVDGSGTASNTVAGNFIGTGITGQTPLPNQTGVEIDASATANTIGGNVDGARNVISGNLGQGVLISDLGTSGNLVEGDYIGICNCTSGTAALGNQTGVELSAGTTANLIGGSTAAARNVISGNLGDGVLISGAGTSDNTLAADFIGTDPSGQIPVGNAIGVELRKSATANMVGMPLGTGGNLISGNTSDGVLVSGPGASGNAIVADYIGTDSSGQQALGNNIGVVVTGGSATEIGGTVMGDANVISGNVTAGIEVSGGGATGTQIAGNFIGTNPGGTAAVVRTGQTNPLLALQNAGIAVIGSVGNVIGGTNSSTRNVISGNYVGVNLAQISTQGSANSVQGNLIGTDLTGGKPLGNIVGIYINGAAGNLIGGSGSGAGNVISANTSVGIEIVGSGSTSNLIESNLIGPAANGTGGFTGRGGAFIQNQGIFIQDASDNTIGGAGAGNTISGNDSAGIFIYSLSGVSQGNTVEDNLIGLTQTGSPTLGNTGYGVVLDHAPNNTIVLTGSSKNQFGRNGIENVRIYQGPRSTTPTAAKPSARRSLLLARRAARAANRLG